MDDSEIKKDRWLSGILGKNCFSVPATVAEDFSSTIVHNSFYHAKLEVNDVFNISKFLNTGFQIITHDITLSLRRQNFHLALEATYETSIELIGINTSPGQDLINIALSSFEFDRFHQDRKIPNHVSDQIKKNWLLNYFNGKRGNQLYVINNNGTIRGFLLLILKEKMAIIDLIAVAGQARGQGLGRSLITHVINTLPSQYTKILVGTQVKNYHAMKLYRSLGFEIVSSTINLHLHS